MAAHGRRRRTMNALLALNMLEFYSSSMMIKGVSALLSAPSSATTAMRRGRRVRGRTMHQRKQHEPLHAIPLTLQIMDASTTMIHHIPTFLSSFVDFPSDYFLHPHHSIITSSSSALLSDVSSATATSLTPQSHHVPHMTVNDFRRDIVEVANEVQKELREELIEEGAKLANTNGPLCRGT